MTIDWMNEAQTRFDGMRALFEDLHRHPEPSHREVRTNARVREILSRAGVELLCPEDSQEEETA